MGDIRNAKMAAALCIMLCSWGVLPLPAWDCSSKTTNSDCFFSANHPAICCCAHPMHTPTIFSCNLWSHTSLLREPLTRPAATDAWKERVEAENNLVGNIQFTQDIHRSLLWGAMLFSGKVKPSSNISSEYTKSEEGVFKYYRQNKQLMADNTLEG